MIRVVWRGLRFIWRIGWISLSLFVIVFLLQRSTYPLYIEWNAISVIVGGDKFDYLGWEANALATKTSQLLWGNHPFMTEEDRSQYVREYMTDLAYALQLESQIDAVYLDPSIDNPDNITADQRAERDRLRDDLNNRQALTESILEGQVATVLADEGFATMGQVLPPISMHFTEMPQLLIVSPRDRIERRVELAVNPMPLEQVIALEDRIIEQRDMDAIIVPLGGMALYPAMIKETANIPWAVETFAHEWVHHYFFFYPLGLSFFIDTGPGGRESVIINETTANIFGRVLGEQVIARYYPEYVPAEANNPTQLISNASQEETFDFGTAMHQTRTAVDDMLVMIQLTQAKVEKLYRLGYIPIAEALEAVVGEQTDAVSAFLETRQQLFYTNGYNIRRLNLAYFAFYGGYQSEGIPGIGGSDPIGPAVEDIFAMSTDLHEFVTTMRSITTREELLTERDAMLIQPQIR